MLPMKEMLSLKNEVEQGKTSGVQMLCGCRFCSVCRDVNQSKNRCGPGGVSGAKHEQHHSQLSCCCICISWAVGDSEGRCDRADCVTMKSFSVDTDVWLTRLHGWVQSS